MADLLGMSEEEKAIFTPQDLSALIGKAFCNTMAIRPRSTFSQFMSNSMSDRRKEEGSLGKILELADVLQRKGLPEQEDWREEDKSEPVMFKPSELDGFFSRLTGRSASGLYSLHSKMNHSCSPNAAVISGSFTDSTIEVIALRDICQGDEVCFSYTDPRLSKTQRRRALQNNHFFFCVCKDCVDLPEDDTVPAGNASKSVQRDDAV